MTDLANMIWIEQRKAIRSRMPLFTMLGSMFIPLAIAFLIYIARNPQISEKLGLVSAKADLVAYAATDWHAYFLLFNQMVAAGGFFFFILTISWIFGREFVDGTLKDLLAVPVARANIVLAKFILAAIWSAVLAFVIFSVGLCVGLLVKLPGGSPDLLIQDSALMLKTACLVIITVLPFALFASIGRGYLLPMGLAVLTLMVTNIVALLGWGEFFPWAIPGLIAQGLPVGPISYVIVIITGLVGIFLTYAWWMNSDQR